MPKWLDNAVFYEIYPQSFQDTNGDGIGDFQGIMNRLDYIKELGCNAIWMNPCFDSPFTDAGYDVRDYYMAAPRYGTNEDLKHLFEEVHKREMHLILDLVPGHTSVDCKWFRESMKAEENEYTNRYIWSGSIWEDFSGISNLSGCIRGISDRDGSCATNFFSTQPALNYGFAHPEKDWQHAPDSPDAMSTRQAMKDVMTFWLEMGCDGFRVDMASSLIKGDTDGQANIALWQDIRAFLDERFPQAAMISEWGQPNQSLKGGFHMDFLLHFGPSRYLDLFRGEHPYFAREGKGNVQAFVDKYQEYYDATNGEGLICIPSSNHDMPRLGGKLDAEEIKLVFAFLLSMPGAPFVYYGDEIGMRYQPGLKSVEGGYDRTGTRTPMQWNHSINAGFSSGAPSQLYIPLDPNESRPTVEDQINREGSLWKEVQKLIRIRMEHSALQSNASLRFIYTKENSYPFVYLRENAAEKILIVLNPSAQDVICTPDLDSWGEVIYSNHGKASFADGVLTVPAASATFIKL